MKQYRLPIVHISEKEIVKSPRLTSSIVSAWVARMIDAGWMLTLQEDFMFVHADSKVRLTHAAAATLLIRYWRFLDIPSPDNYFEIMQKPDIAMIEAKPDEIIRW
jgi:hypothetical protein